MIEIGTSSVIYENPLPQLRSRQSAFPFACQLQDGSLMAITAIGQALESTDQISYAHFSYDNGKTWTEPVPMFTFDHIPCAVSNCSKPTCLPDGKIIALGYAFPRFSEELPLGNPENGGLLDDFVFFSISEDRGKTWNKIQTIDCSWGPHVEASAPITVLKDGTWITPITGFPDWNGKTTGPVCGRALRSEDEGKTWDDSAICMSFGDRNVTCYEQRLCQLDSGAIICIGWNEDLKTGERLNNHYTVSYDNGKTWSEPISTGIAGQASSVCAIGGERLLSLHAIRRDSDRPGIYACVVDFSNGRWDIVEKQIVWEPNSPVTRSANMAEIFSFLKFGQPGAIQLQNGDILMTHWYCSDGQYKTVATPLKIR